MNRPNVTPVQGRSEVSVAGLIIFIEKGGGLAHVLFVVRAVSEYAAKNLLVIDSKVDSNAPSSPTRMKP